MGFLFFLLSFFFFSFSPILGEEGLPEEFTLSKNCPSNFQKKEDRLCWLDVAYQEYPAGIGGLRHAFHVSKDGLSPRMIDLGRYLFFDPVLSENGTLSCAHCHQPQQGFSDGKRRSAGNREKILKRAAPSLWNVVFMKSYNWDGRAKTLEEQMRDPLFSPDEMGTTPEKLESALNQNSLYRKMFQQVFGQTPIRTNQVIQAIAEFERTLVSANSRYDLYAHGIHEALTPQEIKGLNLFRSFVTRCSECHTPPLFSNHEIAAIGVREPLTVPFDAGAVLVTKRPAHKGGFKVPSVRNIVKTAPYMHSGAFGDLKEVVAFYNQGGGRRFPPREPVRIHWHIVPIGLSEAEIEDLITFLAALTDESSMPVVPRSVPSGLPMFNQDTVTKSH